MNSSCELCPICGEGNLHSRVGKSSVGYKGQSTELDFQYSVCDTCGSEQSNAIQLRENKRAMVAFKKRVDGLLSGSEIHRLREKWRLSQADAAKVFGGGPVAFSKYETDDVVQSEAMDKLLRLAAELPTALEHLSRRAGIEHVVNDGIWRTTEIWRAEVQFPKNDAKRPKPRLVAKSSLSTNQQTNYAAA